MLGGPPPPESQSLTLKLNNRPTLPRYHSRDIRIMTNLMSSGYIAQVFIDELQMCCKICTAQSVKAVQREYDSLLQIPSSKLATSVPSPELLGLVVDDQEIVIGILEEFIANKGNLGDIVKHEKEISEERKAKWKRQIKEAVENLHDIDVVWGDGKPENVLVGEEDDLFLVDFGGSWTDGWVNIELRETREGDEMAVEKIIKFLDDGGSVMK